MRMSLRNLLLLAGLAACASALAADPAPSMGIYSPADYGAKLDGKTNDGPAIQAANNSQVFRDFFNFSQFPLERTLPLADPGGATRVEALDMRFGTPAQPGFQATADVNSRLQVVRAWFAFGPL